MLSIQGQQETDTIFNWLGFKIASFDETLVLPQTGTIIPSVNTPTFAFIQNNGTPATDYSEN